MRLRPLENVRRLQAALGDVRQIENKDAEGAHLGNLGPAYADLGETRKAIEYCGQHLAIAREIGDRRGEGANLGNLGSACYHLGELRKAIDYCEQALKSAPPDGSVSSHPSARLGAMQGWQIG